MGHSASAPRPEQVSVYEYDRGEDAPVEACLAIARALPDYFTADAVSQMRRDLAEHTVYVSEDHAGLAEAVAGFAVVERKSVVVAELLWMAVHPARQGQGHGARLLAAIVERLRAGGATLLEVKTLGPDAAYPPYERTRRFYERRGFVHLDTVDPYPGWDLGNPCAIYVKVLSNEA
jgi:GNAT superfamily N-acetyltransferase